MVKLMPMNMLRRGRPAGPDGGPGRPGAGLPFSVPGIFFLAGVF